MGLYLQITDSLCCRPLCRAAVGGCIPCRAHLITMSPELCGHELVILASDAEHQAHPFCLLDVRCVCAPCTCRYGLLNKTDYPYWSVGALSTSNSFYNNEPLHVRK